MKVRIIHDNKGFEELGYKWNKMTRQCNQFTLYKWLYLWWKNYGEDKRLRIYVVEDDEDGREEKEYYVAPTQEIKELAQRGMYITNLRLNVTQNCNLRCKYCFENALENYENRQKMDFETAKKAVDVFLDLLEKNGKSEGNIRFFGGEPLLDFSLMTYSFFLAKRNILHIGQVY